jgi:hypothetical protein
MMRDKELIHSMKELTTDVVIGGVETGASGIKCNAYGKFKTVDNVLWSPESTANILSLSLLKDKGHEVEYCSNRDEFEVKFIDDKHKYIFNRSVTNKKKARHYGCMFPHHEREIALPAYVKDNMKMYSKTDVAKAKAAREQSERLGYMTTNAHCELIETKWPGECGGRVNSP